MSRKVTKTDQQWQDQLAPGAYRVLREHGTERPYSSPLNDETRAGVFHCGGCGKTLFASQAKFDAGCGWPSFYEPAAGAAVGTSEDNSWNMQRTEVHCEDCGGHLGHVFPDGPQPTGLRYCINGAALVFKPKPE